MPRSVLTKVGRELGSAMPNGRGRASACHAARAVALFDDHGGLRKQRARRRLRTRREGRLEALERVFAGAVRQHVLRFEQQPRVGVRVRRVARFCRQIWPTFVVLAPLGLDLGA